MIWSHSTYGTAGEMVLYLSSKKLFGEYFSAAGVGGVTQVKSADNALSDGRWRHIALVVDSSMTSNNLPKLFVDGIRLTNDIPHANAKTVKLVNQPFYIGQITGNNKFNGRIDDIRICDAVLETNEFMTVRSIPPSEGAIVILK